MSLPRIYNEASAAPVSQSQTKISGFSKYAWVVLAYNLLVIVWGAVVRATGSGAGCGSHWPLCQGEVVPLNPQVETIIEFTHRVMSGLVIVLVGILIVLAWRRYEKGSWIRKGAFLSVFFTITESLLGAGLVLFGLVANNDSNIRAAVVALHLTNTFLLIGSIALTAFWSTFGSPRSIHIGSLPTRLLFVALLLVIVIGASGAVTALGDTLFPSTSLQEGFIQDLSPESHFLIQLRVIHPVIAVSAALFVLRLAGWLRSHTQLPLTRKISTWIIGLYSFQIGLGVVNVILLAPVAIQLIHLFISDLIWIGLVMLTAIYTGGSS